MHKIIENDQKDGALRIRFTQLLLLNSNQIIKHKHLHKIHMKLFNYIKILNFFMNI